MVSQLYSPVLVLCDSLRSSVSKNAIVCLTDLSSSGKVDGYLEQNLS